MLSGQGLQETITQPSQEEQSTSSINEKSQLSKLEKDVNDKQRRDEVKHKLY